MNTNTDHRDTVFKAAQRLATGIYGASPAAESLAEKIMRHVIEECALLESRALLEQTRKTWLGHPDKAFIGKLDEHLGLAQSKNKPANP